ncbi:MAG: hypothetical protein HDT43_13135 [Ruminococcaceae bacterium]|nr:hypothetical protein [Oscillospiraceae bacterium]
MNESVFKEILGEALKCGLEEFDNAPEHKFSLKHRLAMKRVFAKYDRNVRKLKETTAENAAIEYEPRLTFRKRIILVTVIIIFMVFLAGCVVLATDIYVRDMYVKTHQTTLLASKKDFYGSIQPWMNTDYLQVPVAGDLAELMESIETGIADGRPLGDILQDRIDRYAKEYMAASGEEGIAAVGSNRADIILIDPETGKVIDSHPKGGCIILSKKIQNMDYATAKSQADDLATFIRYTVLKKESDDPERVSALLSELKEKQSEYDTSRFLPIFYSGGKLVDKNLEYWDNLLGEDGLNWDIRHKDKYEKDADELLDIINECYSSVSADDDTLNAMEKIMSESTAEKLKAEICRRLDLPQN